MPRLNNPDHLGQLVLDNLAEEPDKVCQIDAQSGEEETRWSLRQRSIKFAQHMIKLGLKPGDVVTVCTFNNNDTSLPLLAGFQTGVVVNGVDMKMSTLEYAHLVKITQPKMIFCDKSKAEEFLVVTKAADVDAKIVVYGDSDDKRFLSIKEFYNNDYSTDDKDYQVVDFDTSKILAFIICSSGSTGLPKGVCHTHKSIMKHVLMLKPVFSNYRMVQYSSIYWVSGLMMTVLNLTIHTVKLNAMPFSADLYYDYMDKYKFELLIVTPMAVRMVVNDPRFDDADFSSMKMFMIAGAAIDVEDAKKLQGNIKKGIVVNSYGLSEAASPLTYIPRDVPYKLGSVGKLLPFVQTKVIEVETGKLITEPNKQGELYLKTDCFMAGYYNDPDATAEVLGPDGWYATGDLVRIDEDGFMFIVDRLKDVFKYMGYGIAPTTIEQVINSLPGVEESVVVGIPDKETGSLPKAFVKLEKGASVTVEDVKNIVKDNLAFYCELRGGVVFVDSLAMTPSGKLKRNVFKQFTEVS